MKRILKIFFIVIFPFFLNSCSLERSYEAALVLTDIAAGANPSYLKQRTSEPKRTAIAFKAAGRSYEGDLYRIEEEPRAGLLLVPGAAEGGKDDPRVVEFATAMARARFAVVVPDLISLRALKINSGNVQEVADCFKWLIRRPDLMPEGKGGMVAFSYAAGPVMLAATKPEICDQVQFILAVGGYYDLVRVLTFFTTGYFQRSGEWHYLEPNEYGKWVFIHSNIDRLSNALDRKIFKAMTERKKRDLRAGLDDLAEMLGPEGQSLYAFIANRNPQCAPLLLEGLPDTVKADIEALNLANKDLSRLSARLILIHGYDDNIIPYTESEALARVLPEGQARLFLVAGLAHVTLELGLTDRWRLWRAIDALLAERDRET